MIRRRMDAVAGRGGSVAGPVAAVLGAWFESSIDGKTGLFANASFEGRPAVINNLAALLCPGIMIKIHT